MNMQKIIHKLSEFRRLSYAGLRLDECYGPHPGAVRSACFFMATLLKILNVSHALTACISVLVERLKPQLRAVRTAPSN